MEGPVNYQAIPPTPAGADQQPVHQRPWFRAFPTTRRTFSSYLALFAAVVAVAAATICVTRTKSKALLASYLPFQSDRAWKSSASTPRYFDHGLVARQAKVLADERVPTGDCYRTLVCRARLVIDSDADQASVKVGYCVTSKSDKPRVVNPTTKSRISKFTYAEATRWAKQLLAKAGPELKAVGGHSTVEQIAKAIMGSKGTVMSCPRTTDSRCCVLKTVEVIRPSPTPTPSPMPTPNPMPSSKPTADVIVDKYIGTGVCGPGLYCRVHVVVTSESGHVTVQAGYFISSWTGAPYAVDDSTKLQVVQATYAQATKWAAQLLAAVGPQLEAAGIHVTAEQIACAIMSSRASAVFCPRTDDPLCSPLETVEVTPPHPKPSPCPMPTPIPTPTPSPKPVADFAVDEYLGTRACDYLLYCRVHLIVNSKDGHVTAQVGYFVTSQTGPRPVVPSTKERISGTTLADATKWATQLLEAVGPQLETTGSNLSVEQIADAIMSTRNYALSCPATGNSLCMRLKTLEVLSFNPAPTTSPAPKPPAVPIGDGVCAGPPSKTCESLFLAPTDMSLPPPTNVALLQSVVSNCKELRAFSDSVYVCAPFCSTRCGSDAGARGVVYARFVVSGLSGLSHSSECFAQALLPMYKYLHSGAVPPCEDVTMKKDDRGIYKAALASLGEGTLPSGVPGVGDKCESVVTSLSFESDMNSLDQLIAAQCAIVP